MLAEQLRGSLPPYDLGLGALGDVVEECRRLFAATAELRARAPRTLDVDVDLGDGRRLTGTVQRVHGNNVVGLSYSRLKPRQRLEAWLDLLALSASYPDEHWTAHAVAKERSGPKRALSGPLDDRATAWLADLVALFDLGQTRPLPIPLGTANAWAEAHHRSLLGDPVDVATMAGKQWVTDPYNSYGIAGEDADSWHVMAFGPSAPLSVLLEAGLPELATRVWGPLLTGGERIGPL
jgi:exodeoxyribonuclease V gamma subunit